ncbi:hypothetical protein SC09_Contig19orf00102 [Bacillus subtilis]|uniref:Uncharacterized protein n=1 Tax=Bacillus subtilis TaxID=1423 RepID=A0A0D1KSG3_BACIU|nr:hypothetical protein SC09_Contig19orf00102 [Bacillus subtilis]NDK02985.1 hypothetical protein [Bacillus subtilis subsp. subtilis]
MLLIFLFFIFFRLFWSTIGEHKKSLLSFIVERLKGFFAFSFMLPLYPKQSLSIHY